MPIWNRDPVAAAVVAARRERLATALKAFAETLLESTSKPRRERAPAYRRIAAAWREARAAARRCQV